MPKPLIVGLRGQAGAGKSTIQKLLLSISEGRRAHLGPTAAPHIFPYSMAGPIREALHVIGVDKVTHPTLYRKMAQWIGTEGCREEDPNWWVNLARSRFSKLSADFVVVIDDIRFPNEADLCDVLYFIETNFPVEDLGQRANHSSETWNVKREGHIDKVIPNDFGDPQSACNLILDDLRTRQGLLHSS